VAPSEGEVKKSQPRHCQAVKTLSGRSRRLFAVASLVAKEQCTDADAECHRT
jgi:hypothetical protein